MLLLWIIFVIYVSVWHALLSVHCRLVVTWWERAILLALLYMMCSCGLCHFHMWCPGSGIVLDCIDSWSLPSNLLLLKNIDITLKEITTMVIWNNTLSYGNIMNCSLFCIFITYLKYLLEHKDVLCYDMHIILIMIDRALFEFVDIVCIHALFWYYHIVASKGNFLIRIVYL